jgi:hypothetical protein
MSYFLVRLACGSSLRTARKPVGAVKNAATL